uniref:Leucine zipper transcription factor-like protein 1 n=1 Tax=Steinernema glaseri TaxID=37863 RepID=A0A1I7Z3D6_9BILA
MDTFLLMLFKSRVCGECRGSEPRRTEDVQQRPPSPELLKRRGVSTVLVSIMNDNEGEQMKTFMNKLVREVSLGATSIDVLANDAHEAIMSASGELIFQQLNKILRGRGLSVDQKNEILHKLNLKKHRQAESSLLREEIQRDLENARSVPDTIEVPDFKGLTVQGREDLHQELQQAVLQKKKAAEEYKKLIQVHHILLEETIHHVGQEVGIPRDLLEQAR